MSGLVLVEKQGKIAIVTINRPDALNALTLSMLEDITHAFNSLKQDPEVRCVIFTGAGQKAFSAGIDLTAANNVFTGKPFEFDPRVAIEKFPWPVICAVNGFAVTGGFELVLACDIIVASTNARFADTHAKFGIAPSWGLSQKLSRLIGIYRAKEIHFSGRFVPADEAERWGLVNHVVSPDKLMSHCLELASHIVSMQPQMLTRYKRTIDQGYGLAYGDAAAFEISEAYEYYKTMTPEQFALMKKFIASRPKDSKQKPEPKAKDAKL
eukprot:c5257_g1_i1.p2 GENE.c5257_g1_i1~~c5257_g1_i1.p2  ORF type:complete len:276 (+),score=71.32 c5257_g1_i1:29-829(+)